MVMLMVGKVKVGVSVMVGVAVSVGVEVTEGVGVIVAEAVAVADEVAVMVAEAVAEAVAVAVAVFVGDAVGVGGSWVAEGVLLATGRVAVIFTPGAARLQAVANPGNNTSKNKGKSFLTLITSPVYLYMVTTPAQSRRWLKRKTLFLDWPAPPSDLSQYSLDKGAPVHRRLRDMPGDCHWANGSQPITEP
jgi:hypothetical protein